MVTSPVTIRNATVWYYVYKSLSGVTPNMDIWTIFGWVSSVIPIIFFIYNMSNLTDGYEVTILTRSRTRQLWLTAKFISMIAIAVFYCIFNLIIHIIVGLCFFPTSIKGSSYLNENHSSMETMHLVPGVFLCLTLIMLISGIIVISLITQMVGLTTRNSSSSYAILCIVLFILEVLYFRKIIRRVLSPMAYPSFNFDTSTHLSHYLTKLIFNVLVSACIYFIGVLIFRRYSIANKGL